MKKNEKQKLMVLIEVPIEIDLEQNQSITSISNAIVDHIKETSLDKIITDNILYYVDSETGRVVDSGHDACNTVEILPRVKRASVRIGFDFSK